MGDSTCLMQPFSYVSGIPNEPHEGSPIHALGQSVSFGRFMTDSIAWEKWSSFSHNRYVEEAERYAQPGSVAQKKAFFEAHYKKVAAQRAAALLEQENVAAKSNNAAPPKSQAEVLVPPRYMICEQELREKVKARNGFRSKVGLDKFESIEIVKEADLIIEEEAEYPHGEEEEEEEEVVYLDSSGYNSSVEMENCERVHPITEYPVLGENTALVELSTPMQDADIHEVEIVMELEQSDTLQMEKPLLKESRSSNQEGSLPAKKKKILFSSKSSPMYHRAPKVPTSPTKPTAPCFPRRGGNATPLRNAPKTPTSQSKLASPCFPRRESNATPLHKLPKAPVSPAKHTPSCFPRREGNGTPLRKSDKRSTSPAKPTASCFPRREGNATPLHKLSSDSEEKKRSTPKSLQKFVGFTPMRELSRFTSTVMRKIENSRVGAGSFKTPKDCSTLLKTPTMVSKNEVHKHPSMTPCSEKRRTKTPGDPSSVTGAKTFGPKWCSIRTENKAQSPFSSASFSLRTEERAASRKKKLEVKFNADEAQQMQEKADVEIQKFRQSLCFKARPLPAFYKQRKAPVNDELKVPVTNSQVVGKKHSPRGVISVPANEPSFKSSGSKHVQIQGRNKETQFCSLVTRSLKTVHENTSPNIQS